MNLLAVMSIRDVIQCHHSLMAVDAKSDTNSLPYETGDANPGERFCAKELVASGFWNQMSRFYCL